MKMRGNVSDNSSSSINRFPMLKLVDCFLRISAIPLSIAAIWLTVTNQEDNSDYGKLKFSNLTGLKYMVCISGICAGYAFIAAVSSWLRFLVTKAWLFFISDQIVAYLMVTSGAAVLEILYLAFVLHAVALGCFIILAVISAFRFFSMFDPPSVSSNKEEEEGRT